MHGRKRRRTLSQSIRFLLKNFPCVAVIGARQVGKTTLLKQLKFSDAFFDLEKSSDFERISRDPEFFLADNPAPLIFDEAQLCPELFPALRVKIDERRGKNGQFLISGSSSPALLSSISESLAGRVAAIELGSFMLNEAWGQELSSFYQLLLKGDIDTLKESTPKLTAAQLYRSCLFGGYPEPFLKRKDEYFHSLWMQNYLDTYINRDIRRLFPGLNMENYRKFVRMMSVASGETINISNYARSLDVSQPTAKSYFTIAEGTFLWRSLPAYTRNAKKRIVKMPRGHLRDSGLICHLLHIKSVEDLLSHPSFGHIWEVFIIEQLIKGLQAGLEQFEYYYYRTSNQAEVDLVLEGSFGLVPIEIKTGIRVSGSRLKSLENFIEEYGCAFGVLINNGREICRLSKKVIQIPAVYL